MATLVPDRVFAQCLMDGLQFIGRWRPPGAVPPCCLAFGTKLRPRGRQSRSLAHWCSIRDHFRQLHVL
eukprot:137704-Prymnesium_polylepis.2